MQISSLKPPGTIPGKVCLSSTADCRLIISSFPPIFRPPPPKIFLQRPSTHKQTLPAVAWTKFDKKAFYAILRRSSHTFVESFWRWKGQFFFRFTSFSLSRTRDGIEKLPLQKRNWQNDCPFALTGVTCAEPRLIIWSLLLPALFAEAFLRFELLLANFLLVVGDVRTWRVTNCQIIGHFKKIKIRNPQNNKKRKIW